MLFKVWRQWSNQTPLSILDPKIKDFSRAEVVKCIQISLLCVQHDPNVRPSIATIASYLNSDTIELPTPEKPVFFLHSITSSRGLTEESSSTQCGSSSTLCSINQMSESSFIPR